MIASRLDEALITCAEDSVMDAPNPSTGCRACPGSTLMVGRDGSAGPTAAAGCWVSRFTWSGVVSHMVTGTVAAPANRVAVRVSDTIRAATRPVRTDLILLISNL